MPLYHHPFILNGHTYIDDDDEDDDEHHDEDDDLHDDDGRCSVWCCG